MSKSASRRVSYSVETNVTSGDPGFALVHAVVLTLLEQKSLKEVHCTQKQDEWGETVVELAKAPKCFLKIGDKEWKKYSEDLIPALYEHVRGDTCTEDATLSAWVLSLHHAGASWREAYRGQGKADMLCALIGRGANILKTLQQK